MVEIVGDHAVGCEAIIVVTKTHFAGSTVKKCEFGPGVTDP